MPGQVGKHGAAVPMAQVIHEMVHAGAMQVCRVHGVETDDETPCMHRSHFYVWVNGFFQEYSDEDFGKVMRMLESQAPEPEPV